MWHALAVWCTQQVAPIRLPKLGAAQVLAYMASRSGVAGPTTALTPRYQWRLLSLVARVQAHRLERRPRGMLAAAAGVMAAGPQAQNTGGATAAPVLSASAPRLGGTANLGLDTVTDTFTDTPINLDGTPNLVRHAEATEADDLPMHLSAPEAQQLQALLTGDCSVTLTAPPWVEDRKAQASGAEAANSAEGSAAMAATKSAFGAAGFTSVNKPVIKPTNKPPSTAQPAPSALSPAPATVASKPLRWQDHRDRCAAALQLGAGLGPGDLRALRVPDVVLVATPGQPPRLLPQTLRVPASGSAPAHNAGIAPWAALLLADWLTLRSDQGLGGDWLFPSTRSGKPWGKVAQYEAGRRVLAQAGLDPDAGGSFRLRHSFALRQLQFGHSPDQVAAWLGVVDPAVITRYQKVLGTATEAVVLKPPSYDVKRAPPVPV